MATSKRSFNHPRRSPSNFRWWHVVAVLIVIAAVFLLLEHLKTSSREEVAVKLQPAIQLNPPQAALPGHEQNNFSSARAASPVKTGAIYSATGKGSVAIIVDDMGSSLQEANEQPAIS